MCKVLLYFSRITKRPEGRLSIAKLWPELAAEALADVRENVADGRPEQCQDDNNDNSNENQDQSVFD